MARILLVHGAFAGAWCWEPALPGLRDGGHSLEAIDLPGAGEDTTPVAEVTLDAYGKKICRALSEGPPAILAGQSMGGMAITQAAARCPEHVRALIYIAAFAPAEGQSLVELVSYPEAAGDQVQANVIIEGDPPSGRLTRDGAVVAMLNCCTEEQVNWAVPRLGPQPVAPWAGKVVVRGRRARRRSRRSPGRISTAARTTRSRRRCSAACSPTAAAIPYARSTPITGHGCRGPTSSSAR